MKRAVFIGSKRVGLRCLEAMLERAPDAVVSAVTIDDSRDVRTVHRQFIDLCHTQSLPLHTINRRAELPPVLEAYRPDLCIVVGWYWMIPDAMIASCPLGFVGLHFSLLPLYRGSSPLVWAMINGEAATGVSMFSLVREVDAGDLWAQRRVDIYPGEYVGTVLTRLEDVAVDLVKEVFPRILRGEAKATAQEHSRATFFGPRSPEDGVIDWHWPSDRVLRFIRAQSRPYPGAFTHAETARVTIWRASEGALLRGNPGDVLHATNTVQIVCGDNRSVMIEEAERDGVAGPAWAVLDSTLLRVGDGL